MTIIESIKRSMRNYDDLEISLKDMSESIQRSRQKGIRSYEYDNLGIVFCARRVDKKMTVDELSKATGVDRKDIIDLELSSFHLSEAIEIAARLRECLGIKSSEYNTILASSTRKK